MDLSKYIGETTTYDKKLKLEEKKPKSWLKSVSAFANTKGGCLIFGLEEDNTVVGLEDYQKDSEVISEIIKTRLDPVPNIDLKIFSEDDKHFIVVHIESGMETPYYVIEGGSRTAYTRIGNESAPATSSNLKNLVLKGMKQSYDTLITNIPKRDASFTRLIAEYHSRTGKSFEDKDLYSFGLVNKDDILTNAGALFADENLIYQSRVFCTRWNGLDKASGLMEALDDRELEGGLLYLLDSAINFVKSNTKKMWRKGARYRVEYPEYPERSITEAIVNALIHREYTLMGAEVHIDIYDDRIEIYSPGGMFDGTVVQEQNLYDISSTRRNPVISDLFSRMNLMERRGSGLRKIVEAYQNEENYTEDMKPKFLSTHSNFRVVMYNLNYKKVMIEAENKNVGKENAHKQGFDINVVKDVVKDVVKENSREERLSKIVDLMKKNKEITIDILATELSINTRTVQRDIKMLQDDGIIERVGGRKDGYWQILK
ncbi:MAG: AAA family ATPase [Clostridiales bacterium]|nr:MAG: AAA family ATPase [Clostridiales bacterium]